MAKLLLPFLCVLEKFSMLSVVMLGLCAGCSGCAGDSLGVLARESMEEN